MALFWSRLLTFYTRRQNGLHVTDKAATAGNFATTAAWSLSSSNFTSARRHRRLRRRILSRLFTAILMFEFWREATATSVPGLLCQSGRRRPENASILSSLPSKQLLLHTPAAPAQYRNVDVTLAWERFCDTNKYLQALRLVWDVNGFS